MVKKKTIQKVRNGEKKDKNYINNFLFYYYKNKFFYFCVKKQQK
jgi:hypothetical protein